MRKVRETERRKQQIAIHRSVFDVTFFHIKTKPNKFSFLLLGAACPFPSAESFALLWICVVYFFLATLSLLHTYSVLLSRGLVVRALCVRICRYYRNIIDTIRFYCFRGDKRDLCFRLFGTGDAEAIRPHPSSSTQHIWMPMSEWGRTWTDKKKVNERCTKWNKVSREMSSVQ